MRSADVTQAAMFSYRTLEHAHKRIMKIEEKDGATLVTTTDIHLARGIGEAIHNAYQGIPL